LKKKNTDRMFCEEWKIFSLMDYEIGKVLNKEEINGS